ncbi:hypothetical protein J3R82DRAFT_9183 [Butyriboletus roseoflavus]|nr:hypothetical protein J3R82DRAFT_9183 [Butyriboletus roseoflavus]
MSSPQSEDYYVSISSVALNVREELGRNVDHIIFQTETGTFTKEISVQVSSGREHNEVFDPAIELSAQDRLSVSVQYPSRWQGKHTLGVTMELNEVMAKAQVDTHGQQTSLFKLHKHIEVAISLSRHLADGESSLDAPLPPTAGEPNASIGPIDAAVSIPQSEDTIHISSIALDVRQQFGNTVDHITFQTEPGSFKRDIDVEVSPGQEHKEVFDPVLELSPRDQLSVLMEYKSRQLGRRTLHITVRQSEVVKEARDDAHGNRTYMKFHKHIMVSMSISRGTPSRREISTTVESPHDGPLPPSTSDILRICPRFRLLLIGNSGVGKSTLIQKVFGIHDVDVSEASRGHADINREFIAADNGLFVLHDSVGLEAGESKSLAKVKQFIDGRRKQQHVKDKLHAVWVCLAVPYAEGRLLEAGVEEFLRDREKILGNIPIVVVLTKVDLLDGMLLQTLRNEGVEFKSVEEAQPKLEQLRSEFLEQYCTQPLVRAAGRRDIPRVAVSTKSGFRLEPTISELVKTTTSEIERYIKADPAYATAAEQPSIERNAPLYIAGMAQRVSIETKVDLTIALAKKRYWTILGSSLRFSDDKVKENLLAPHQDIIQVWNFNDPEMALLGDAFKAALLETSDLGVADNSKSSPTIAKRFMTYIADLIYVMKILIIIVPQGSVTSRDVALALQVYEESTYRTRVHLEIKDFSTDFTMLPGRRDRVLEKLEMLVRRYSITDEEVSRVRARIDAAQRSS